MTKRVGERKRFACIPIDAADTTHIEITVESDYCLDDNNNYVHDVCNAVLTPRLLWVSWKIISTAIDNAKGKTEDNTEDNTELNLEWIGLIRNEFNGMYYHITAIAIGRAWHSQTNWKVKNKYKDGTLETYFKYKANQLGGYEDPLYEYKDLMYEPINIWE